MAISFVGSASAWTNDVTSTSVTIPSTILAGDFALLFYTEQDGHPAPKVTGWTLVGSALDAGSTAVSSAVFRRNLVASDAGTKVTATATSSDRRILQLLIFRGVDPTTPVEAQAATVRSSSSATHTVPTVTTVSANSMGVEYVSAKVTGTITFTTPSGVTLRKYTATTGGANAFASVGTVNSLYSAGASAGGHVWTASGSTTAVDRILVLKEYTSYTPPSTTTDTTALKQFNDPTDNTVATAVSTNLTSVTGTGITHQAEAAVHGTLGLSGQDGTSYVTYAKPALITAADGSHTGSLYVRPRQIDDGHVRVMSLRDATTSFGSISVQSDGKFGIVEQSGNVLALSSLKWVANRVYRLDWQYNGATNVFTVRIYAGGRSEWNANPNEELSTILDMTGRSAFSQFRFSPTWAVGVGSVHSVDIDTFRVYDGLASWPLAYAPSAVAGSVVHSWVGAPTPSGFRVRSRFVDATSVRLAVSTASNMASPVYMPAVSPDADEYADVTATGLAGNTQYYYQWRDTPPGGSESAIGSIGKAKTLPAEGSNASFTFAISACITDAASDAAAINSLVTWAPAFNLFLGDFHYIGSDATDPDAHRDNYRSQIDSVPGLPAMIRDVPMMYVPSDGEAGGNDTDSNNDFTAAHIEGYKSIVPHYPLVDTNPVTRSRHQAWTVGRVRFIMVDVRNLDRSPGADPDTEAKTMLGNAQKDWLKAELVRPEFVKVIVSDVAWMGAASVVSGVDRWWSYATERQELIDYIAARAVKVVFIHADTHVLGAATTVKNTWGGFPVYCAAPLHNTGGGLNLSTFSSYYDNAGGDCRQYGRVTVTDSGTSVTFDYVGWDAAAAVSRVTQSDVFTVTPPQTWQGAGTGSTEATGVGSGVVIPPPLGSLPTTIVTGTFLTETGSPVVGSVVLTPPFDQIVSTDTKTIVKLRQRTIKLVNGGFSLSLIAPDEQGSWTCDVIEPDGNRWDTIVFRVPSTQIAIDLADYVV